MGIKSNVDNLIFELKRIEDKTINLEPVMKQIASDMASTIRMNFKNETTPDGVPWEKSDRAIEENGKTLQDTGRLRNSITYKYTGTRAAAGTNVKYARSMHFGVPKGAYGKKNVTQKVNAFTRTRKGKTENVKSHSRNREIQVPWGNIPSRKFVGITERKKQRYLRKILEYIGGRNV